MKSKNRKLMLKIIKSLGNDNKTGLMIKKDLDGKERIVGANGEIPSGTELQTTYYPNLIVRVVSQMVDIHFRGAKQLGVVFNNEEWKNGVKEMFFTGLAEIIEYDKNITMETFNPFDPYNEQYVVAIDKQQYASIKTTITQLQQAFTSLGTLTKFITDLVKNLGRSFLYQYQNQKAKILAEDTGALIDMNYDKVFDAYTIEGIEPKPEKVLEYIANRIYELNVASPKHLAISVAQPTIVYSAEASNLVLVYNSKFRAKISLEVEAKFFGPNAIVPSLQSDTLAFNLIQDIDTLWTDKILAILIDKEALVVGFQLSNTVWNINVPKLQILTELHNWYGYASKKNFYKELIIDNGGNPIVLPTGKVYDKKGRFDKIDKTKISKLSSKQKYEITKKEIMKRLNSLGIEGWNKNMKVEELYNIYKDTDTKTKNVEPTDLNITA